jgi:DNA-binding NtrC family response regulator
MEESPRKVLLIDVARTLREQLSALLPSAYEVQSTVSTEAVFLARTTSPTVIVIDATVSDLCDSTLIQQLRQHVSGSSLLVISPAGEVKAAVEAIKSGASEVLDGAATSRELVEVIEKLSKTTSESEVVAAELPRRSRRDTKNMVADFGPMAGRSPVMFDLFEQVNQLAQRDTTVLITGESGTGKELIAREIHRRSPRANKPFVAINCAAIPETLIESELFGHERGAFTHAVERRLGQFELADGGTLFLDEIGELSLAVQVKLLRFLQEQEFFRVGRAKPISVDVRVITATNRNLDDLVRNKQFRQDLLYRINVINLHIPPLRERASDVPLIVTHCLKKLGPLYGGRTLTFSPDALDKMMAYGWPGNVRELENVVESLLALAQSDEVGTADLPPRIRSFTGTQPQNGMVGVHASGLAFDEAERIFETNMIVKALHKANFVQTRAAELLGISRRILKYKMDKLRIDDRGEVSPGSAGEEN